MNSNFDRLAAILSSQFKVPIESVLPTAKLQDDLDADSLDAATAIMEIEDAFGIIVPDRGREYITVQDILIHIEELISEKAQKAAVPPCVPVAETTDA